MSFAPEFTARWEHVLQPALRRIKINAVPLDPFRVDLSKAGDAILTEILQGIGNCAVIIGDITALGVLGDRAVRNANVLYEVGVAHASRRPEEVVLFRSDKLALDFDVQGVRVHSYDPDGDVEGATTFVANTVLESLHALDSARHLAIRFASQRLTLNAHSLLLELREAGAVQHPPTRTMGEILGGFQRVAAIELLLDLGALQARPMKVTDELLDKAESEPTAQATFLDYEMTAFGKALADHVVTEMLPTDPKLIARIAKLTGEGKI